MKQFHQVDLLFLFFKKKYHPVKQKNKMLRLFIVRIYESV